MTIQYICGCQHPPRTVAHFYSTSMNLSLSLTSFSLSLSLSLSRSLSPSVASLTLKLSLALSLSIQINFGGLCGGGPDQAEWPATIAACANPKKLIVPHYWTRRFPCITAADAKAQSHYLSHVRTTRGAVSRAFCFCGGLLALAAIISCGFSSWRERRSSRLRIVHNSDSIDDHRNRESFRNA